MFETYVSKNCRVAVSFIAGYEKIDPRTVYKFGPMTGKLNSQYVTTCIIRPLDGPKTIFVGAAVCSPADHCEPAIGQRIALARAVQSMLPDLGRRECGSIARGILRSQKLIEDAAGQVVEIQEAVNA